MQERLLEGPVDLQLTDYVHVACASAQPLLTCQRSGCLLLAMKRAKKPHPWYNQYKARLGLSHV